MVIFDEPVKESRITSVIEWTLCTDNYYTKIALAKHMFNDYGWTIVGTLVPHDITFLKF